jgi:hypothetical protein
VTSNIAQHGQASRRDNKEIDHLLDAPFPTSGMTVLRVPASFPQAWFEKARRACLGLLNDYLKQRYSISGLMRGNLSRPFAATTQQYALDACSERFPYEWTCQVNFYRTKTKSAIKLVLFSALCIYIYERACCSKNAGQSLFSYSDIASLCDISFITPAVLLIETYLHGIQGNDYATSRSIYLD